MNPIAPPNLPPLLEDRWQRVKEQLHALPQEVLELCPGAAESVSRVALCSEFVLGTLLRQPEALLTRLADGEPLNSERLQDRLRLGTCPEAAALAALRRSRHVETARIAWRDLAGWSSIETDLGDLSRLADSIIRAALDYATAQLVPRFGRPVGVHGEPESLMILAMGKLGGNELNFSSDVDLVLLYPDSIAFEGHRQANSEVYFRRLGQFLIRLLDQMTADGMAYRVDIRLRPFGSSGPLAVSLSALEAYLMQHGRDWERYAYQKARLITGRRHSRELFDEILIPFVYRRYVDFGVFPVASPNEGSDRSGCGTPEPGRRYQAWSGGDSRNRIHRPGVSARSWRSEPCAEETFAVDGAAAAWARRCAGERLGGCAVHRVPVSENA